MNSTTRSHFTFSSRVGGLIGRGRLRWAVLWGGLALGLSLEWAGAVVTPVADRSFCRQPGTGRDIIAQMVAEATNPLLSNLVVHFVNDNPVDVVNPWTYQTNRFVEWTGTLISPEWVLTCAHTVQGSDGRGAGVNPGDIYYNLGSSEFPDPARAQVAEVHLHPSWTLENYEGGYDLALIRLSVPVRGIADFPRLSATPFRGPLPVVLAGYGHQGDGFTGGTGPVGYLRVGVNTLDAVGGSVMFDGHGAVNPAYAGWPGTVAFMDFDQLERREFTCNGVGGFFAEFGLADFSSMGGENVGTAPVYEPCGAPNPPVVPGAFAQPYCDFLPSAGDSGGPAFLSPTLPNIPGQGYHLTAPAELLAVVSYRSAGTQATATSVYGNVVAYTLVQPYLDWIYRTAPEVANRDTDLDGRTDAAELAAGTDPYLPPRTPSTYVPRPEDVVIEGLRILRETVVGAGLVEFEFTGDLRNTDSGRYANLSLDLDRSRLPAGSEVVDPLLNYASLAENGATAAPAGETLIVRVPAAEAAAARQAILDGSWVQVSAYEEQVYAAPARFVDAPTDQAFVRESSAAGEPLKLVFSAPTDLLDDLQPGDLLIADSARAGYQPLQPTGLPGEGTDFLVAYLPFQVTSVQSVNGEVHVIGDIQDPTEMLKSGTFLGSDEHYNGSPRDLLDPLVENTHTSAEKDARFLNALYLQETEPTHPGLADLLGMDAIPWRFNDVAITPTLTLSGQVLLRSSGLRFRASIRDFALKRVSVGIDAGVTASMVLETTGTNHNVGAPLAEQQRELVRVPLPGVPMNIAGVPCTLSSAFILSVGAEVSAPAGLSIPLETSVNLGTEIGWADGQSFVTPIREFTAPRVSDPTVFDAVRASARAWAEARLEVSFGTAGRIAQTGPSLAVRANAAMEIAPLDNPWWTLDAGAELVAGFGLEFLGLSVAYTETTEEIATFFHRDAGGPLAATLAPQFSPANAGGAAGAGSGVGPVAGQDLRWALAFAPPNANGSYTKGFVTPLQGGGSLVGGSAAIPGFLGVISSEGRVEWMQTFPFGGKPVEGAELPDGALLVAGYVGFDWWLAEYDRLGNRRWVRSIRQALGELTGMAVATGTNGAVDVYLAGFQNPTSILQSDPVVARLNRNGDVIWNKVFRRDRDDEVYGIRVLRDGHVLLTGLTDAAVGTDPLVGARGNGLLMKLSPEGEVDWATAVPGRWGMVLRDAAEGPDGSLYAVGAHGDLVLDYYPSILVAKFTSGGALVNHVLLGEDREQSDVLPDSGDTPYDVAVQCAWVGDSLIVAGNTGLGPGTSAWLARVTDQLGVRWMTAFDGPIAAGFGDLAVTDRGIQVMGAIDQPWPGRFTNRTPTWLLSLPWEGLLRFHPNSGIRSHYLQPRIFLSSEHPDFIGRVTVSGGRTEQVPTTAVIFSVSNAVAVAGANVLAGTLTTMDTARLERLEPSVISTYAEWLAYQQISGTGSAPGEDLDGDGVRNLWEFFSGSDPLRAGTNAPVGLTIAHDGGTGLVTIEFVRSMAATGQPFALQYSVDLQQWFPVSGVTQQIVSADALGQRIRLTLPEPHIFQAFFRLILE